MKNITKQTAAAFLLVMLSLLFISCSENYTGNVNKANTNQKALYNSFLDATKAGVNYDNSITRISPKLVKSNSIQTYAELTFYESWNEFNSECSNIKKKILKRQM